ncbi:hypothetical protein MUK42_25130 [Musa troglodytarum]|uniref:Uncharacterized protein n=1 Tax=Musa troglodytarum TaxID=320322 RepID=A0A9E7JXA4_9LILI|nr:hypothetical protein MUK42_25130 [Musa troglodytarum]
MRNNPELRRCPGGVADSIAAAARHVRRSNGASTFGRCYCCFSPNAYSQNSRRMTLRLLSWWETETELGVGGLAGGEASITDDLSVTHSPTHPLFLLLEELEWRAHEQPKQANLSSYEAVH